MRLFNKKLRKRYILLALFIAFIITGIYYWFLQHEKAVNNGIGRLQAIYKGHTAKVWVAKFSPNDSLIASAGVDSTVQFITKQGKLLEVLKHPQGVTNICFSPDGTHIATTSYDEKVRIWDVAQRKMEKLLEGHAGTVWTLAYSPDGNTLATAGEDKTIRLWDVRTGRLLNTFTGHTMNIWAVIFSKDGKSLISGSFDRNIIIWNIADGRMVNKLQGHTEAVVSLAFNDNGTILASGSDDQTIRLWSFPEGKLLRKLTGDLYHVYGLAFQPGGSMLLSGHLDKPEITEALQNFLGDSHYNKGVTARLWNINTGELLQTFSAHGNDVNDVDWSHDGNYFVTCSEDKSVHVWKVR
jgi:WD40 repeat protein